MDFDTKEKCLRVFFFNSVVLKYPKRISYMAKQMDGVIEAVRFKNGQIAVVRMFERRGAAFSDWVMLDRKGLLERLKQGKLFVTGKRQEFLANTFTKGVPVLVVQADGREFISTRENADADLLENVPFF
jgi:hypothetical protein